MLVVRLRSLGDCVLTTPALALLKGFRPDLRVGVVVEERFRAVFEGNEDVEELLGPSAAGVARWGARLCLDLHGGNRAALLTLASGARCRAGFAHARWAWSYGIRIPRAQQILGVERVVHTAEHIASAMFYLGVPRAEIPRAKLAARPPQPAAPFAVIHPFAAAPEKSWPAGHFLAVADSLSRLWGIEPVFIGTAGDDLRPFARFRTLCGRPLSEIKDLIAGAALFIGNDSGPAHMAAAFGVPTAVVFGPSDPRIWGPWRAPAEVLVGREGIERVKPDQMLAALERLRVTA